MECRADHPVADKTARQQGEVKIVPYGSMETPAGLAMSVGIQVVPSWPAPRAPPASTQDRWKPPRVQLDLSQEGRKPANSIGPCRS